MTKLKIHPFGQPDEIMQTAADWALRQERQELDEAEWDRFEKWLQEYPAHSEAFEDVLWALGAAQRHTGSPELLEMRKEALQARKSPRRQLFNWGGVGGAIAASLALFWFWSSSPSNILPGQEPDMIAQQNDAQNILASKTDYSTAIGERSEITLPDGTTTTLDTNSKIEVAYGETERAVYLVRGQALFDVAQNKDLPFRVYANDRIITAMGTIFNVRVDGTAVKVALVEGVVQVREKPEHSQQGTAVPVNDLMMKAGEVLEASPRHVELIREADVVSVASWKGGTLVFNDTALATAVAEINRYTASPITIADSSAGDLRVTGVFKSNDPKRFAEAMTEIFPLEIDPSDGGSAVLRSTQLK